MPSSPVAYPVGDVTLNNNEIRIDELLNDPIRVTRMIADIAEQDFYMDEVFDLAGGVEGGATIFERPPSVATDLYASRDVKEIAPGDTYPLLTFERGVPMLARPTKLGGRWFVTKEAIKRNNSRLVGKYITASANTLNRKVELRGVAELQAVITAETRYANASSWADFAALTVQNRTGTGSPLFDISSIQGAADAEERGHKYDSILLNTQEWVNLIAIYSTAANVRDVLAEAGITNVIVSHRYPAGKALLFEKGALGELRFEFGLEEKVTEEGADSQAGADRTWYQFSISPSMFVDDQFAMWEMRGLDA